MSKPLDELGGKCPYMPFLDKGQMSVSVPRRICMDGST